LLEIVEYLAVDAGDEGAWDFRVLVDEALSRLSDFPLIGAKRFSSNAVLGDTRMWVLKHFDEYLLFYQPCRGGIRILRIIHAKRDYRKHL
jgi:plasmid stabilization system protein ParE